MLVPVMLVAGACAQVGGLVLAARMEDRFSAGDPVDAAGRVLAFGAVGVVGALLAARIPRNALGWLMLSVFTLIGCLLLTDEYATYSFTMLAEPLPGAVFAAWVSMWAWYPSMIVLLVFVPLLFPTGRLLSRRWRPVAWAAGGGALLVTANAAVSETLGGPMRGYTIPNPIGLSGVAAEQGPVDAVAFALVLGSLAGAVASVAVRFRRSRGIERLQMKWMVLAAAYIATLIVLSELGVPLPEVVGDAVFILAVVLLPVAIGVAVLRYRLYEIDRLVSRTLSYAVVTGVLVIVYAGGVMLLGGLLSPVTQDSAVAVAASTLLVVALFGPLRGRVQAVVDRRFYRTRYDAQRTVEVFAARLRDEVDLDEVRRDLLQAVTATMQPDGAAVCLVRRTRA